MNLLARFVSSEYRNHGRCIACPEPRTVAMVHYTTATKGHDSILFGDRNWQVFPTYHVFAYRVPPAHMSPLVAGGVVLVEKMVLSVVKDQSVGIIHPIEFRAKMKLWPQGLIHVLGRFSIRIQFGA